MNRNVITHILDSSTNDIVSTTLRLSSVHEKKTDSLTSLFDNLLQLDPMGFILEINTIDSEYIKIIKILKKSNITRFIPVMVIVNQENQWLLDTLMELKIEFIVYPPFNPSIISFYVERIIALNDYITLCSNNNEISMLQSVIISGLASLAEYRDPETGEHIKRTQNYVKALALELAQHNYYNEELTEENIDLIYISVPLHDIGKVGIRDSILLKPGKLTSKEFDQIKEHTTIGYEAIINIGNKMKGSAFLHYAADVAYTHHEKFDGSGYPRGLKGDAIPIAGRLMAIADVYDALISKRVYKEPMDHIDAVKIILEGRGSHFDPIIVDCFMKLEATFNNIAQIYKDSSDVEREKSIIKKLRNEGLLRKVLVVEDSKIVRTILQNQLESVGLKVDVAADGLEGYELASKIHYDLVLLDLEMPRMNGYQMAKQLMMDGHKQNIIAITAADYNITHDDMRCFGIDDVLLKPIDIDVLALKFSELILDDHAIKNSSYYFPVVSDKK